MTEMSVWCIGGHSKRLRVWGLWFKDLGFRDLGGLGIRVSGSRV